MAGRSNICWIHLDAAGAQGKQHFHSSVHPVLFLELKPRCNKLLKRIASKAGLKSTMDSKTLSHKHAPTTAFSTVRMTQRMSEDKDYEEKKKRKNSRKG